MYGAGILILFDEPSYDQDSSLQANTYLRKEMPLRFPLYMFAVISYGLLESTFSLWGEGLVSHTISIALAQISASSFWLAMILGQGLLFFLLQRFDPKKFYLIQSALILASLIWLANALNFSSIVIGMVAGGLGCSALFAVTLFFLMQEIHFFSANNRDRYLTLIENGVSWITAGYLSGMAFNDLITDWIDKYSRQPFLIAILYLFAFAGLIFYLNRTREQNKIL